MGKPVKLSSREIMEQLDLKDWVTLCSLVDVIGPKTQIAFGNGPLSPFQEVAGQVIPTKFDVCKIVRDDDGVYCFLDFGHGILQWYELTKQARVEFVNTFVPELAA
jgi:hypothetical protein